MKTIEKRADQYIGHPYEMGEGYETSMRRDAYIQGATEQKVIDEKSQIEEMRNLNEEWKENLRIQREMLIEKACEWLENWAKATEWYTIGESIEMLRKAMEE